MAGRIPLVKKIQFQWKETYFFHLIVYSGNAVLHLTVYGGNVESVTSRWQWEPQVWQHRQSSYQQSGPYDNERSKSVRNFKIFSLKINYYIHHVWNMYNSELGIAMRLSADWNSGRNCHFVYVSICAWLRQTTRNSCPSMVGFVPCDRIVCEVPIV